MGKTAAVWASLLVLTVSCSSQIAGPASGNSKNDQSGALPAAKRALIMADARACSDDWGSEESRVNSANCLEETISEETDQKTTYEMTFRRGGKFEVKMAGKVYPPTLTPESCAQAAYSLAAAVGLEIGNSETSSADPPTLVPPLTGEQGNELITTIGNETCKATVE
ncbi:hypothetical protein HLB42_21815 (plasmid) [Deinococcus sp. D7000]|nr:hypothetical protein HLB42_21815 [Deinococcus sp. D7000]